MQVNTDGIKVPDGDCPCKGEQCHGAHGWTWKSADLGNSSHRGRMWAEQCPGWRTTENYWCVETGTFKPCPPPTPPGMTPENFSRFIDKKGSDGNNWDNVKQSREDLAFNSKIERGISKDIDKGTHINDQQGGSQ
tara:strand:- start:1243 stop:1647 length:405 start_codon:yes stop_codon:yes gene_type:complete